MDLWAKPPCIKLSSLPLGFVQKNAWALTSSISAWDIEHYNNG